MSNNISGFNGASPAFGVAASQRSENGAESQAAKAGLPYGDWRLGASSTWSGQTVRSSALMKTLGVGAADQQSAVDQAIRELNLPSA